VTTLQVLPTDRIARWTSADVATIADARFPAAPPIGLVVPVSGAGDLAFWDAWPIQERSGAPCPLDDGSTLWMALGAPRSDDPEERHGIARIHLVRHDGIGWHYLRPVMPEGFSPGSREWSGSAVLESDGVTLTLYFTAAGRRGEAAPTFEQRLFSARCTLARTPETACTAWRDLHEIVARDPAFYMGFDQGSGTIGTIKAFRDPAYFQDPRDGAEYLFFAGSLAGSDQAFNGVVGAATRDTAAADWVLLPPVLSADGLNNELERPHVIHHDGLYYLFWSTQSHVFDPAGPVGPTGLYGMASRELLAGWRPLNGSGLVFANPIEAPAQAYSWLVMPDLHVTSFADQVGVAQPPRKAERFGGSFAPFLTLRLDGWQAGLAGQP
jgi:levansucrase